MSKFKDLYNEKISSIEGTIKGTNSDDVIELNLPEIPNNLVKLNRGDDIIKVNTGEHIIKAGRGDDLVESGDGSDLLSGGRGEDTLNGQDGEDFIFGNRGDDLLIGGDDDDYLHGGRGHDELRGGTGDDTLTGGRGNDIFVHSAGDNLTVISDFQNGKDKILLEFEGVDSLDQVLAIAQDIQVAEDIVTVVVDANNTLTIQGKNIDENLDASDFLFG